MDPKCPPNPSLEASKWARRLQNGSRGAKMASMRLQELPKMASIRFQELPKTPTMDQCGPKMAHMDPNMIPRVAKMAPKGPNVAPRWAQDGPKRIQKRPSWIPKWDIVRFKKH